MGLILAIVALVIFVLVAFSVVIGTLSGVTLLAVGFAFLTAALIAGISLPAFAIRR